MVFQGLHCCLAALSGNRGATAAAVPAVPGLPRVAPQGGGVSVSLYQHSLLVAFLVIGTYYSAQSSLCHSVVCVECIIASEGDHSSSFIGF